MIKSEQKIKGCEDVDIYHSAINDQSMPYRLIDENLHCSMKHFSNSFPALQIRRVFNATVFPKYSGVFDRFGEVVPESMDYGRVIVDKMTSCRADECSFMAGDYIFMGKLYWHFGHFFNDSCMRFWALGHLDYSNKKLVFILDGGDWQEAEKECSYYREYFSLFGIDVDKDIVYVAEPTVFESLHVPSGANAADIGLHPYRKSITTQLLAKNNVSISVGHSRLYMSRSMMPASSRQIINDEDVQKIHESFGFTVVHPYQQTMMETVSLFHDARLVSGAMGSGWNNIVFCPDLETSIVLFDKDINTEYTYASPIRHTRFLAKNCWGFMGTLEPAYTIGASNYVWFSTPSWANIDLLRKQLAYVLNEKIPRAHFVPEKLTKKGKCCIFASLAESFAWYNLYDDGLFFLSLARKFNDQSKSMLWDGPLQQIKNLQKAKDSFGAEGLGIAFSKYPQLADDIRQFAEDEDYIDRYASLADYLAMLVPRMEIQSVLVLSSMHEELKRIIEDYALDFDSCPVSGKLYDCVLVDGSLGYVEAKKMYQVAKKNVAPNGLIIVDSCFPYNYEYHFRIYHRHTISFYNHDRDALDTWKLVYDISESSPEMQYVTLNGAGGILLIVNAGTANDTSLSPSGIDAMGPEFYEQYGHEFMRILQGRYFRRLMQGSPVVRDKIFSFGNDHGCFIRDDFGFSSNDVRVFHCNRYMPPGELPQYRLAEFVAYAYRFATGADLAIAGRGEPSANIYIVNGRVLSDLDAVLPQGNMLCVVEMAGQELERLINGAIRQCTTKVNGFYPHLSGVDVCREKDGSLRICNVGWRKFRLGNVYTVALNSYFAAGNAGFQPLRGNSVTHSGIQCVEALKSVLLDRYCGNALQ